MYTCSYCGGDKIAIQCTQQPHAKVENVIYANYMQFNTKDIPFTT